MRHRRGSHMTHPTAFISLEFCVIDAVYDAVYTKDILTSAVTSQSQIGDDALVTNGLVSSAAAFRLSRTTAALQARCALVCRSAIKRPSVGEGTGANGS